MILLFDSRLCEYSSCSISATGTANTCPAQTGDLQAMLILPEVVFLTHLNNSFFDGRADEFSHFATALADEMLVMTGVANDLVMAVVVAVLDLPHNA